MSSEQCIYKYVHSYIMKIMQQVVSYVTLEVASRVIPLPKYSSPCRIACLTLINGTTESLYHHHIFNNEIGLACWTAPVLLFDHDKAVSGDPHDANAPSDSPVVADTYFPLSTNITIVHPQLG